MAHTRCADKEHLSQMLSQFRFGPVQRLAVYAALERWFPSVIHLKIVSRQSLASWEEAGAGDPEKGYRDMSR